MVQRQRGRQSIFKKSERKILMSFYESQEEARANLIMQVRETIDAAEQRGGLDAEALQKVEAIEADIEKIDRSLEVAKRQADREAAASAAVRDFAPVAEEREGADLLRSLANGDIRSASFEQRATLVPSANTVPVGFADQVFALARLVGPMLNTSQVFTRNSGESFRIPTLTAYGSPAITAAGSTIADTEPSFSSFCCRPFKVPGSFRLPTNCSQTAVSTFPRLSLRLWVTALVSRSTTS
jgi:HK97 family phage major capsid protein